MPKIYQDRNPRWGLIQKCLTIDIPIIAQQQLSWVTIVMSRSAFQSDKRPFHSDYGKESFTVDIHYPGQRYRFSNSKIGWAGEEPKTKELKSYIMHFRINNIEVMNQRNTKTTPCKEQNVEEDDTLKSYLIRTINCTPPYWKSPEDGNTSMCSSKDQMRKFYNFDIGNFIYPCRRLTQASYEYSEYVSRYYNNLIRADLLENLRHEPGSLLKNVSFDSFSVSLQFSSDRYKEIVLSRQFDLQNLIGNAGGYVGICVGYSFLQLPKSITMIVLRFKSYIRYK